MVADNVPRMDHSLVRFFVVQILQTTGPPYSATFAHCIFDIVSMPDATLAIKNDPESVVNVGGFARDVSSMGIADLKEHCDNWVAFASNS